MPWQERDVESERLRFVHQFESGGFSMRELCTRMGVSRPTGYLWWRRYQESGRDGLQDRSRRPLHSPHRTAPELEAAIVRVKEQYPDWGPVTIIAYLRNTDPKQKWPAPSTASRLLDRHGLVKRRRKRRPVRHPGRPHVEMAAANDTWSADYKGQFKTRDGRYCFPLTIEDGYSRCLLAVRARRETSYAVSRPVFEETFRLYGLPHQILSDSGPPFATNALAGLSRMSIWWIKLGIHPIRIQPGRPDQNGRHERMHRTLAATTRPPAANLSAQQRRFTRFLREYNEVRPHHALDLQPPASYYAPSPRPYPSRLPELEYDRHLEVRRVDAGGRISWRDRPLRIAKPLRGELVALEAIEEHLYRVYFGPVLLGVFNDRTWELHG